MKNAGPQMSPLAIVINSRIEQKSTSVAKLTEVLHCSADSLYRRLRGETDFLLHEATILAQHLGLSLDALYKLETGFIQFNTRQLIDKVDDNAVSTVAAYVAKLHKDFTMVDKAGIVQMYYAAKDLPLFAFFANKELVSFKLYFWYLVLFSKGGQKQKFEMDWLPSEVTKQALDLYDIYTINPSSEIWNFETINSTIHQVQYCRDCGLMSKDNAQRVLQAMQHYLSNLEASCESGTKQGKGKFSMYLNEILILDNSVIFDLGAHKIFYMPYQTLNFFNTTDAAFVEQTITWMNKQKQRSVLISETGDKDRARLFAHYAEVISAAMA
ncbi:MAG: hypothetical protein RL660_122 [Bacteroidota bacterium]|jgi:hypothetical protein